MNGKTIINIQKPQTQTVTAVKSLLSWRGRASDPLPQFVELGSGESKVVLVLSNKRDSYYTVTRSDCSCPAAIYHRGRCKHQRKFFPEEQTTTAKPSSAIKQPNHGAWHGHNGPVLDEARPAKAASIPLVDTLGEPGAGELAYWSIQADREMWPAEA